MAWHFLDSKYTTECTKFSHAVYQVHNSEVLIAFYHRAFLALRCLLNAVIFSVPVYVTNFHIKSIKINYQSICRSLPRESKCQQVFGEFF